MTLLTLRQISFTYQGRTMPALDRVSLDLEPGQFLGLAGRLGAGKSTLIRSATGLIPQVLPGSFSGEVLVKGQSIAGKRPAELAGIIGTVFQDFEAQLFSTTVTRELAFGLENLGLSRETMAKRISRYAEWVGLGHLLSRSPQTLSGGQKQRLAIAAVLALEPDLILADEPTTDLDPRGKQQVDLLLDGLVAQGRSVALVENDSSRLLAAQRLLILDSGRIVAEGPPEVILADPVFCHDHGLAPPQLFTLFALLGLEQRPTTIQEARNLLDEYGFQSGAVAPQILSRPASTLIDMSGVDFAYPGQPLILEKLDLGVSAGDFLALLGPNGSGKTTLVKIIAGLLAPNGGRFLFRGRPVEAKKKPDLAREIGLVLQDPDRMLFAATVEEEVAFGPRNFGYGREEVARRVEEALATVGLTGQETTDPFTMTRGQRQKLAVAAVLASRPEVIILDEPTTGLDAWEQLAMMDLLTNLNHAGHTIIIVTHAVDLAAAYARRLALMAAGRIIADGTPGEVFDQPDLLARAALTPPACFTLGRSYGLTTMTPGALAAALESRRGHQ